MTYKLNWETKYSYEMNSAIYLGSLLVKVANVILLLIIVVLLNNLFKKDFSLISQIM